MQGPCWHRCSCGLGPGPEWAGVGRNLGSGIEFITPTDIGSKRLPNLVGYQGWVTKGGLFFGVFEKLENRPETEVGYNSGGGA